MGVRLRHDHRCHSALRAANRKRELRGPREAALLPGAAKGQARELLIVTLDQEVSLIEQGKTIRVIPAWKWLG